jgi:X-Pro dipeptidyl-peptidase
MRERKNRGAARSVTALVLLVCLLLALCPADAMAEALIPAGGPLRVENGMMQPMLTYSFGRDWGYTNADSDILRFCVYVETDYDTDGDVMNDLVKAFVELPRVAAEGKYKAAVIYDPTPYAARTLMACEESAE